MRRFFVILSLAIFISCGSLPTQNIKVGMSKEQFLSSAGKGRKGLIGSKSKGNDVIEVMRWYKVNFNANNQYISEDYYIYFINDVLVQWGRPQDWQREADRIYEVRLSQS